jgi:hypothetical protein
VPSALIPFLSEAVVFILGAMVEELFYRWFLLKKIRRKGLRRSAGDSGFPIRIQREHLMKHRQKRLRIPEKMAKTKMTRYSSPEP